MADRLHLSAVVGGPLADRAGKRLGRVEDVIVRLDGGGLPPVTGVKARIGRRALFVPADQIADLESGLVRLSKDKLDLGAFERRPGEVLLRDDVLGHKLIDVAGARLVTAHDVALAQAAGRWHVVGIVGARGAFLRRLLPGGREPHPDEQLVPWERLEPLVGHVPTSRLRIGSRKLAHLHPAQIADLVEAASHDEGDEIIRAVGADAELEADVFEELDDSHQAEFVSDRSNDEAARLIARMASDDAADLVAELPQERRERVLALLPGAQRRQIQALLGYHPRTAGGLMSPEFVRVGIDATVQVALDAVRTARCPEETLGTVVVVDEDGRIAGTVTATALVRAPPETPVAAIAAGDVQAVRADADLPDVARLMSDFNLVALPVVDDEAKPIGLVTVDDVLELVLPRDWRLRHLSQD